MAGHSKFKNIQHRKGAQDKKRAKLFTKLVRDIVSAAKSGFPDPEQNPKLRGAIIAARAQNLPKERIDKAISQASSDDSSDNFVPMRYEGFASGGIAIIVEAETDNKNRTAAEVRSAFNKYGGNLGETGSVSFMFDHVGIITYLAGIASSEEIFENSIEAGASDIESDDAHHIIYTDVSSFSDALEYLTEKYGPSEEAHIGWRPHNLVEITQEKMESIMKLIDALEDSDDVHQVFSNFNPNYG